MTSQVDVENLDTGYEGLQVVSQVSFSLAPGEIGCILGPSGCGKTTVLRAIAGFEPAWRGRILIDQVEVSSDKSHLFQDFALFPHLKVEDNVRFGLKAWGRKERQERVQEMLAIVGMLAYAQAYPHQLSGGQQQRIALARALAPRPGVLLLDEPFSNMDAEMREQLAREVRSILKQENNTAILVTHDQNEAFAMADRICVMTRARFSNRVAATICTISRSIVSSPISSVRALYCQPRSRPRPASEPTWVSSMATKSLLTNQAQWWTC